MNLKQYFVHGMTVYSLCIHIENFTFPDLINIKYYALFIFLNPLTPNDQYMGRTAPLTSKRCILYIYSTNIGTEYFEHAL
jgi:hypothetical protein